MELGLDRSNTNNIQNIDKKKLFINDKQKRLLEADYYINALDLKRHIEGGYYREIFRSGEKIQTDRGERSMMTSVYYLLKENLVSVFHKLPVDELWTFHNGDSLTIHMIDDNGRLTSKKLGMNLGEGELPQIVVPKGVIFGAELNNKNTYTLFGCTVSPGFEYSELIIPERKDLFEKFPQHTEVIKRLTQ